MKNDERKFFLGQLLGRDSTNKIVEKGQRVRLAKKYGTFFGAVATCLFFSCTMALAWIGMVDEYIAQPTVAEVNEEWERENHGTDSWFHHMMETDPDFRREVEEENERYNQEYLFDTPDSED